MSWNENNFPDTDLTVFIDTIIGSFSLSYFLYRIIHGGII